MKKMFSGRLPQAVWIWIGVGGLIVVLWLLVRTFVIGAIIVPTTSMEKTIRRGNKLLVNKLTYRPIDRGDMLVFHFPVGDTVIDLPDYRSAQPYYDVIRELGRGNVDSGRRMAVSPGGLSAVDPPGK